MSAPTLSMLLAYVKALPKEDYDKFNQSFKEYAGQLAEDENVELDGDGFVICKNCGKSGYICRGEDCLEEEEYEGQLAEDEKAKVISVAELEAEMKAGGELACKDCGEDECRPTECSECCSSGCLIDFEPCNDGNCPAKRMLCEECRTYDEDKDLFFCSLCCGAKKVESASQPQSEPLEQEKLNMDYSDSLKTILTRINDFLDEADWIDYEEVQIEVKDIPKDVMDAFCLKVEKAINTPDSDFVVSVEFEDSCVVVTIRTLVERHYPNMFISWDMLDEEDEEDEDDEE